MSVLDWVVLLVVLAIAAFLLGVAGVTIFGKDTK